MSDTATSVRPNSSEEAMYFDAANLLDRHNVQRRPVDWQDEEFGEMTLAGRIKQVLDAIEPFAVAGGGSLTGEDVEHLLWVLGRDA